MYIPKPFSTDDAGALNAFMGRHAFAILVTAPEGVPTASHLPFLIEDAAAAQPTLRAHMARANPQWKDFARIDEALVVFQGAHAYVSPGWYANPGLVPTWNYVVVHAYGKPRVIADPGEVRAHVARLVERFEGGLERAWRLDSLSDEAIDRYLKAVVAFEIPVGRLEGKFKLGQNRAPDDRAGAVQGLRATGDPGAAEIARLMAGDGT